MVPTYLFLIDAGKNMPDRFEILQKDLAGRIGRLSTPQGNIETPALMPVVNPHLHLIPPPELARMGADMIITNSYIIHQDGALRARALEEGLHALLGFDGLIMTDSGAFQLSVYGDIDVQPREILDFQAAINRTSACPWTSPRRRRTQREGRVRAEGNREKAGRGPGMEGRLNAGRSSAGLNLSRFEEQAGRFLRDKGFDLYPIGAVVPLMEAYRFSELVEVVTAAKRGLGSGVPVHLFGAGHPMVFALAAAMGCDLFDSAAYALYARQGRYLTVRGTWKLEEMNYLPCSCPVCQGHNPKELKESAERVKLLASHNLYVSFQELKLVKQCIREASLWDLLESRCRAHPGCWMG